MECLVSHLIVTFNFLKQRSKFIKFARLAERLQSIFWGSRLFQLARAIQIGKVSVNQYLQHGGDPHSNSLLLSAGPQSKQINTVNDLIPNCI